MSICGCDKILQKILSECEIHSVLARWPPKVALSLIQIYGRGLHGASNRIRRRSYAGVRAAENKKQHTEMPRELSMLD